MEPPWLPLDTACSSAHLAAGEEGGGRLLRMWGDWWGFGGARCHLSWIRSLNGPRGGSVTLALEHKQLRIPASQIASPSCARISSRPGWGISCCWRWRMLMSGFVSHRSLPGEAEPIPSSLCSRSSHPLAGGGGSRGGLWVDP